jgi:catechol 2,3-dioxygenase-like lactoylglutathione lyase family enzyme
MLDHVSLGVRDIERSRHFYDAALRPLGLVRIVDFGNGRHSDYGAAPGSLGVEFTITREPELRTPICWRTSLLPRARSAGGTRVSRRCDGGRWQR